MSSDLGINIQPEPQKVVKKPASVMPETIKIVLEENDDIPPTGLFVGLNGRGYLIRPGEEVTVPSGVVEILTNAVMSSPQVDPQTRQVLGYRERMRYPFRRIST
jgi:hypothetical protein